MYLLNLSYIIDDYSGFNREICEVKAISDNESSLKRYVEEIKSYKGNPIITYEFIHELQKDKVYIIKEDRR